MITAIEKYLSWQNEWKKSQSGTIIRYPHTERVSEKNNKNKKHTRKQQHKTTKTTTYS